MCWEGWDVYSFQPKTRDLMEMADKIESVLEQLIIEQKPLAIVSAQLRMVRDLGATQEYVIRFLNNKKEMNAVNEDWISEVLDIATGWCQDQYRVWAT
jgi:hypothetical protein